MCTFVNFSLIVTDLVVIAVVLLYGVGEIGGILFCYSKIGREWAEGMKLKRGENIVGKIGLIGLIITIPVFTYATSLNGILAIKDLFCKDNEVP